MSASAQVVSSCPSVKVHADPVRAASLHSTVCIVSNKQGRKERLDGWDDANSGLRILIANALIESRVQSDRISASSARLSVGLARLVASLNLHDY